MADKTPWPPHPELDAPVREWAAWWSGDPDALTAIYSNKNGSTLPKTRASQQRGGLVGRVARWFWGAPQSGEAAQEKVHIPVAADIATTSATLLFSEPPTVALPEGSTKGDRLAEIVTDSGLWTLCLQAAEASSSLSGAFIKIGWNKAIANHPLFDVVHPDAARPKFESGALASVIFETVLGTSSAASSVVYRLLEEHVPGRINYGLFEGTQDDLGERVGLDTHLDTYTLSQIVDEDEGIDTGYEGLTAVYVKNLGPQKRWRHHVVGRHLGRSDLEDITGLMDKLDKTWTSLMRDLDLAQARIFLPEHMLDGGEDGEGYSHNTDQTIFIKVNSADANGGEITMHQPLIRVEEHLRTAHELLRLIYTGAGYSPSSFGLVDEGGAVTAAEVTSRQRKTMATREHKTRYWTKGLQDLLTAAIAVDAHVFGGERLAPGERVTVEFPAAVTPTLTELAGAVALLAGAQAASIRTRVRLLNPDWTDEQVDEETARIMEEQGLAAPVSSDDFPA